MSKLYETDELARLFNVDRRTIQRWTREGMPIAEPGAPGRGHGHRFDLQTCLSWWSGRNAGGLELTRARTRLAHEQSETARLKNEATRTNLVPLDLLTNEFRGLLGYVIQEARKIPDQLAPQLEGQTIAQRKATLEKAIFDLLDRSVEWRPDSKTIAAEG